MTRSVKFSSTPGFRVAEKGIPSAPNRMSGLAAVRKHLRPCGVSTDAPDSLGKWTGMSEVRRLLRFGRPACIYEHLCPGNLGHHRFCACIIPSVTIPEALIEQLSGPRCVSVLTGAGVSAESRVPTFRDAQTGLWAKYRPEDLATPNAFRRNPRLVWEWYEWRRQLVAGVKPNPAHLTLAEMEKLFPAFHLTTQNVDGLHQRAGSVGVIELHGNITRTKCFDEDTLVSSWSETDDVPPKCPRCGGLLRPDVVWFEEALPEKEMLLARQASAACDIFFAIGTSAMVQPAASLPLEALYRGATVVEINPQHTSLTSRAQFALHGAAGAVLPELLQQLRK